MHPGLVHVGVVALIKSIAQMAWQIAQACTERNLMSLFGAMIFYEQNN